MPNRLIKESIFTSGSLAKCSILAQAFFHRMLPVPDDHGCFDARRPVLRAKMYPLCLDKVTEKQIDGWIKELAQPEVDCIRLWTAADGIEYGWVPGSQRHYHTLTQHNPQTPCPPWLLDPGGNDLRLATETLLAFDKIGVAVEKLTKNGRTPTYREIIKECGCSNSTLAKYWKYKTVTGCATPSDTVLPAATGATHKNPNPNPNPIGEREILRISPLAVAAGGVADEPFEVPPVPADQLERLKVNGTNGAHTGPVKTPDLPPGESNGSETRRTPDEAYEVFAEAHQKALDAVYVSKKGDFVQLARLRKAYNVPARASPPHWAEAVKAYFSSPLSCYTVSDLCTRFAMFRNGAVDRFGKLGGSGDGQRRQNTRQNIFDALRDVDGDV